MEKINKIAGVDEAGRGCLAGPVFAAAVILNNGIDTKDIKDSKKISFNKRIELCEYIKQNSIYALGSATVKEIDKINILKLEINAEKIMKGLGFENTDFIKNINNFSGGWKMRAELSRLLVLQPEILLLDEPTNHLDLPAIIWLENFLNTTKCTIILVSHDTEFLKNNTTRIFDISQGTINDFKGNYSKYIIFKEKEIELVASWICDILDDIGNGKLTNKIAGQVKELCSSFPVYK